MNLDEFIDRTRQHPIPQSGIKRVRMLARDLAEGAAEEVWKTVIALRFQEVSSSNSDAEQTTERITMLLPENPDITRYLLAKWGGYDRFPHWHLLESNGFFTILNDGRFSVDYKLTQAAYELVEVLEASSIFISYKRSESSALALLVMNQLKQAGLDAFLDLALIPGENWYGGLKQRIESKDYFVLLLGPHTLESKVVIEEIGWAIDAERAIIPVWHGGFVYRTGAWTNVPVKVDRVLSNTHTIRVIEENPLAYHNAILELLNYFGFTP